MNNQLTTPFDAYQVRASESLLGTEQYLFRFPSGYGASVVRGPYTYGGSEGKYELASIVWFKKPKSDEWDWSFERCWAIENDCVVGWLSEKDVVFYLTIIYKLPRKWWRARLLFALQRLQRNLRIFYLRQRNIIRGAFK